MIATAPAAAQQQPGASPSRGELLYGTHCIACHTTEVHWRQQKLATDRASLEAQVRRWAANAGLAWSDEDIADVARFLNATQYRFEAPSGAVLGYGAATTLCHQSRKCAHRPASFNSTTAMPSNARRGSGSPGLRASALVPVDAAQMRNSSSEETW
jgi:hypothetical protein